MNVGQYPTQYKAKRWIFFVETFSSGLFGIFSLIFGPLFLSGMKNAKGEPATDAGLILTLMSIPVLMTFFIKLYRLMATREPILKICQEGIVFKCVAMSDLDRFRWTPKLFKLLWLTISGQGFRSTLICIPWEYFQITMVTGFPMARILTIQSSDSNRPSQALPHQAITLPKLHIHQVLLNSPLEKVAEAIESYSSRNAIDRKDLPSWF